MKKIRIKILSLLMGMTFFVSAFALPTYAASGTKVFNTNVSKSEATCNASNGSLPASVTTVNGGSSYFVNFSVSEDLHVVKAVLYVKTVGSSSYTKVKTITPSKSYIRYDSYKYTFTNTAGTVSFFWKLTYYSSSASKTSTKTTSTISVTVKKTNDDPDTLLSAFLSDSRWKSGTTWSSSQKPKLSSYSSTGCAAYCADLVKYVYGKSSPRSGTSFTSVSSIQAGDVLVMKNTKTGKSHWIYVYGRSGSKLYVVEGNYNGKVSKSTSRYTISGSYVKTSSATYRLVNGYHYE